MHSSFASTAYVVASYGLRFFDCFVEIWATCKNCLGKWFTAPPPPPQPKIARRRTPMSVTNYTLGKTLKDVNCFKDLGVKLQRTFPGAIIST